MRSRNWLHVLTWPLDGGLRDGNMGSDPIGLATDDEPRAGIDAEGWTVTTEEIEALDKRDPEIVRVVGLIRRLARQVAHAADEKAFSVVGSRSGLGSMAGGWNQEQPRPAPRVHPAGHRAPDNRRRGDRRRGDRRLRPGLRPGWPRDERRQGSRARDRQRHPLPPLAAASAPNRPSGPAKLAA